MCFRQCEHFPSNDRSPTFPSSLQIEKTLLQVMNLASHGRGHPAARRKIDPFQSVGSARGNFATKYSEFASSAAAPPSPAVPRPRALSNRLPVTTCGHATGGIERGGREAGKRPPPRRPPFQFGQATIFITLFGKTEIKTLGVLLSPRAQLVRF